MKYTKKDIKGGDILIAKDGTRWIYAKLYHEITRRYKYEYIRIRKQQICFFSPRGFDKTFDDYLRSKVSIETDIIAVIPGDSKDYKPIYIEQQILDYQESEYLRSIIKPFRRKVAFITLALMEPDTSQAWICICVRDDTKEALIQLPKFTYGTMYKGMQIRRSYTLKELRI